MKASIALMAAIAIVGCVDRDPTGLEMTSSIAAGPAVEAAQAAEPFTVMTRNLYLGTDVSRVLSAQPQEIPAAVAAAWSDVLATDFSERAVSIAREIASSRPHLVGLQEVALYRLQTPGDFLTGNSRAAEEVAFDFLEILLAELNALGLDYRPAIVLDNTDVELPLFLPTGIHDVRVTIRDAILVRGDVAFGNERAEHYDARLQIPTGIGTPITVVRGWSSVDATVQGRTYQFVNTHLEAFNVPVQEAQARELLEALEGAEFPVILVGDLNSLPDGSRTASYGAAIAAGFRDVWSQANPRDPGFTCCHAPDLGNGEAAFDERIDFLLVRDMLPADRIAGAVQAAIVGADPANRTGSGLWPSDHGGVIAWLRAPRAVARR